MSTPVSEHTGYTVCFSIPGEAVGKGRARATVVAGSARLFTPKETRTFESLVKDIAGQKMAGLPIITRPVEIEVTMHVVIPASWPDWKRQAAVRQEIAPTGKPDTSNVLKAIEDAINGVVFLDDSQVFDTHILKLYCTDDQGPRTDVVIRENWRCSNRITKKDDLWLLR